MSDESTQVFNSQVEARRYVDRVMAHAIRSELRDPQASLPRWFTEGVTHEPSLRRIRKALLALAARLQRAAER